LDFIIAKNAPDDRPTPVYLPVFLKNRKEQENTWNRLESPGFLGYASSLTKGIPMVRIVSNRPT
jgi:hypothetical protein